MGPSSNDVTVGGGAWQAAEEELVCCFDVRTGSGVGPEINKESQPEEASHGPTQPSSPDSRCSAARIERDESPDPGQHEMDVQRGPLAG